jgi:hypothetical protein
MLYWSLQITILSIIFIFLIHHLIHFFKSTLTVPKIKDLVNTPNQKYENMYNIISQNNHNNNNNNNNNSTESISYTEIDLLPKPNVENMKNELKSFLKEQLKTANASQNDFTTDISTLDSLQSNKQFNTYSEY